MDLSKNNSHTDLSTLTKSKSFGLVEELVGSNLYSIYFDISLMSEYIGRIVFEIYDKNHCVVNKFINMITDNDINLKGSHVNYILSENIICGSLSSFNYEIPSHIELDNSYEFEYGSLGLLMRTDEITSIYYINTNESKDIELIDYSDIIVIGKVSKGYDVLDIITNYSKRNKLNSDIVISSCGLI